jgi:hypothetical protein
MFLPPSLRGSGSCDFSKSRCPALVRLRDEFFWEEFRISSPSLSGTASSLAGSSASRKTAVPGCTYPFSAPIIDEEKC